MSGQPVSPRPRRWRHALRRSFVGLITVLVALAAWDAATYDARAWLADYAGLKRTMAQGYANLDGIARDRGVDLPALDRRTTQALSQAHSRVRAYFALRAFIGAFNDPHLRLQPRQAATAQVSSDVGPPAAAAPAATVARCQAAGYEDADHAFHFPYSRLPSWRPLQAGAFPTGVLGDVGVLRIAQFGEERYLTECERVFRPGLDERALQLAVRARLQQVLRERIAQLRRQGARHLLVDISGNGGGSEWVSEVIALMTARTLHRAEARVVGPRCDRSAVWQGAAVCPVFGEPAARASLVGTGEWNGPLLILTDGGTASASEDFVAWLQQNGVARVIGERTMGAGCGYVDGGTRYPLRVLPLDVMMPNCARFLENGRNEIDGLSPDVPIVLSSDEAPKQVWHALQFR